VSGVAHELKVAAAQFAVSNEWQENLEQILPLIERAENDGVDLLVLPEGVLARFMGEKERIRDAAQPLDGPFVTAIRAATVGLTVTTILGIHETSGTPRPYNTLVAVRDGEIVHLYRKMHLYDAFAARESDNILPDDVVPELLDVNGFQIGLMTCYDVRFPELARLLAVRGADAIVLPAAWAKGPSKEFHWSTLVSARALDNTVYMIASGESGATCIGLSMIVDPLGIPLVQALAGPEMITATITKKRLADARSQLPVLENRRFDVDPTPRILAGAPVPSFAPSVSL
jgi:predicted amidohydrolase